MFYLLFHRTEEVRIGFLSMIHNIMRKVHDCAMWLKESDMQSPKSKVIILQTHVKAYKALANKTAFKINLPSHDIPSQAKQRTVHKNRHRHWSLSLPCTINHCRGSSRRQRLFVNTLCWDFSSSKVLNFNTVCRSTVSKNRTLWWSSVSLVKHEPLLWNTSLLIL